MSDYSIRVDGLGKRYRIGRREKYKMLRDTLRDAASSTWEAIQSIGHRPSEEAENEYRPQIWALKDASFEIQPGDSVGIIGSNGAGKTTLLKILARITAPTTGRVHLRGRVGSLLEVGTGFHPELTGRENIYLNGAILGMRKVEIDRKFDEIVEFSEVEKFLDTPVKFFSSGMRVRLAFSVAAHLETDILLVDEVLAVGDVAFQKKSLGKMDEVAHLGRTVLFVSHNMAAVKSLCRTGLYIEKGQMLYFGEVEKAIDNYLSSGELQTLPQIRLDPNPGLPVQIVEMRVENEEGKIASHIPHDQPFSVMLKVIVRESIYRLNLGLFLLDSDLDTVLSTHDFEQDEERLQARQPGVYTYRLKFPAMFVPGDYRLSIQATRTGQSGGRVFHRLEHVCPFEIFDNGSPRSRAALRWTGKVAIPISWDYERTSLNLAEG